MSDVMGFLRYVADPSRPFDLDLFDSSLRAAKRWGYVSVQSKGQVMLTPRGYDRLMGGDPVPWEGEK